MEAEISLHQQNTDSEVASTNLTPQQLYQHDPILILLKNKVHLNTFWFFTASILLSVGCFFVLSPLSGLPPTPRTNIVRVLDVFTSVLFYAVYFYLPDTIAKLFNTLIDNRIIDVDTPLPSETSLPSYETFLRKFKSQINSYIWLILALPFVIAYLFYSFQLSATPPPHSSTPPPLWIRIEGDVINLSIAYTCILSILRITIALIFLYRLLKSFPVHVNPLHPDGAGGLGILRQILWISAGIMLGVALAFYEDSIQASRAVDIALLIAAYAVLIPSLLIGWLILPHQIMLKARNAVLQPLTDEYNKIIKEKETIASDVTKEIVARTERLAALTQRYELCHKTFPIWPLEIAQMRQVLLAFILPALIGLISAIPSLIDFFTKSKP
jgi:hypothetical protein